MPAFGDLDWAALFGVNVPVLELFLRGTAMYWFLFLVFRFVVGRRVGTVGIADILLLVIVADAAQNGMAGEYRSITEGCILVAVLIFWDYVFDFLAFRVPWMRSLFEQAPLEVIRNGRMLRRNMAREQVTEDEVQAQLREKGVDQLSEVKAMYLEADGRFSVIRRAGK
jgi:uncharacterized membrane protein YcaP (DUF421 family)